MRDFKVFIAVELFDHPKEFIQLVLLVDVIGQTVKLRHYLLELCEYVRKY